MTANGELKSNQASSGVILLITVSPSATLTLQIA